jgi:hypothetical protein
MVLGALIIKTHRLGLTHEELVEQIKENPYFQFFIGREVGVARIVRKSR